MKNNMGKGNMVSYRSDRSCNQRVVAVFVAAPQVVTPLYMALFGVAAPIVAMALDAVMVVTVPYPHPFLSLPQYIMLIGIYIPYLERQNRDF